MVESNPNVALDLIVAVVAGLALLIVTSIVTRTPEGSLGGFPLGYMTSISNCGALNPLNGCGFSYDFGALGADLLFWAALTFGLIFLFDSFRVRGGASHTHPLVQQSHKSVAS